MGILKPCLSVSGGSVVVGKFALYDEVEAINVLAPPGNPGFDDVMGEPFLEDNDDDQVGERVRPEILIDVLGKVDFVEHRAQRQDPTGNAPESRVRFRVSRGELVSRGLLVNGVLLIRNNDRLLQLVDRQGRTRYDFVANSHVGFFVYEVRPGETGTNIVDVLLEQRRPVER